MACAEAISSIYSNLVSERNEEAFQTLTNLPISKQRKRETMTRKVKKTNTKYLFGALSAEADRLIKNDVNIKYSATSKEFGAAAKKMIAAFDVKVSNLHHLMKLRDKYELLIDSKYKTCISDLAISAQQQLNECNVPTKAQVILGLLHCMIGIIARRAKLIRIIYA